MRRCVGYHRRVASTHRDVRRTALTALLLAATAAPTATAQEEGLSVDPASPAGKEYAIPLEQARRQAAGGGGDGGAAPSGGQPLFGEGIRRADGSASGVDGGGSGGRDDSREGAGSRGGGGGVQREGAEDASPGARDVVPSAHRSAAIEAAAADGSDGLLTAGIAGAVLAAGLVAGFGLRKLLKAR
jgi:hypothetical protein